MRLGVVRQPRRAQTPSPTPLHTPVSCLVGEQALRCNSTAQPVLRLKPPPVNRWPPGGCWMGNPLLSRSLPLFASCQDEHRAGRGVNQVSACNGQATRHPRLGMSCLCDHSLMPRPTISLLSKNNTKPRLGSDDVRAGTARPTASSETQSNTVILM